MSREHDRSARERITALEAANERLEAENRRFEVAWDAARAGIYEHRVPPDGSTYRSEHWADILGYDRNELPPPERFLDWLHEQVHPDDHPQLDRAYQAFVAGTSDDYRVEVRLRHKRGHWVWARGIAKATHRDEQGHVRKVVGMMMDITTIRSTEEALRESEARFREMVDGLPLVVWVHDAEGRQELVNQTFCEFFGVTQEEMKDGRWQTLVHPDDAEAYNREFVACLEEHRPFRAQVRVRRGDGQWRWFESWGRPRFTPSGDFRGIVGASADITDRKEVDASLREADRRKDEYLAMLGHELRNPLAALRSATELLKLTQTDDPRLRRAYGVLDRQSNHMKRLVDGLLEVSRVARGKIDLNRATVDLRLVLEGVLQDREAELAARGLDLEKDFSADPVWVVGDPVRLAQVFDNIVANAAQFTEGPGTVSVVVTRQDANAVVIVRDTGIGIRPEMLRTVFEPFQQDTQDVSRAGGGLGLGLALARELVGLHGGSIEARSDGAGTGTELHVRLPSTSAPADAARKQCDGASAQRILLVEDNLDAAEMLSSLLQMQGHEVTVVDTGQRALEFLEDHETDVVLCDIGLPRMSGYDVARAVRSKPALRTLPLVAVTGYGQPEDRKRTMEAGFDEHVTKPVELSTINDVLRRVSHHDDQPLP